MDSNGAVIHIPWLIDIIKGQDPQGSDKLKIQEVVKTLSNVHGKEKFFHPSVVSLGPCHHHNNKFEVMERYKGVAARWFISFATDRKQRASNAITEAEAEDVYQKFIEKAPSEPSLRDFYKGDFLYNYNPKDFMKMMFLDGCFILHIIHLVMMGSNDDPSSASYPYQPDILSDMFLFENQIPFSVLRALMDAVSDYRPSQKMISEEMISDFISKLFLPPEEIRYSLIWRFFMVFLLLLASPFILVLFLCFLCCCNDSDSEEAVSNSQSSPTPEGEKKEDQPEKNEPSSSSGTGPKKPNQEAVSYSQSSSKLEGEKKKDQKDKNPQYLLEILKTKLFGELRTTQSSSGTTYFSRPITELKATGIKVRRGESMLLKDVKFKKGWLVNSFLKLPPIIIDASTKTLLLNLVASEMCPDAHSDRLVSSYICFMDRLIYNAADVKELRSKDIVLNRLGSDEEVVKLFEELATNLFPNYNTYSDVMSKMERHKKRKFYNGRLWIGQLIRSHFANPWTVISLMAATALIALTVVQTIYAVLSYKKDILPD